jgi:hypothetical protein
MTAHDPVVGGTLNQNVGRSLWALFAFKIRRNRDQSEAACLGVGQVMSLRPPRQPLRGRGPRSAMVNVQVSAEMVAGCSGRAAADQPDSHGDE